MRSTTSGRSRSRARSCCAPRSPSGSAALPSYASALRDRSELWVAAEFSRHDDVPRHVHELQPRVPTGPGDARDDVVRRVRQVPLHRPRARAVRATARDSRRSSAGREPIGDPARHARPRGARAASSTDRGPSSASATPTSARRRSSRSRRATDRADQRHLAALAAAVRRRAAARRAPRRPRAHELGGAGCGTRSPLATSPVGASGVFGVGIEGRAAVARLVALGCDVVLVDDDPAATGDPGVARDVRGRCSRRCAAATRSSSPRASRTTAPTWRTLEHAGRAGARRRRDVARGGGPQPGRLRDGHEGQVDGHDGHGAPRAAASARPRSSPATSACAPFDPAFESDGQLVVLETSSFQATDVAHSPHVVAVTSLGDDHLDWHGSAERYHADKLSLTRQAGARHTIVADTASLREHREQLGGEVALAPVGRPRARRGAGPRGAPRRLERRRRRRRAARRARRGRRRPRPARGGRARLRAARRALPRDRATRRRPLHRRLAGDEPAPDDRGPRRRRRREGRAPRRRATTAASTTAGLAAAIAARPGATLVVTLPDNGPSIGALVAQRSSIEVVDAADVARAVAARSSWLGGEGVVLLSPAAPSFSQFRSWAERSAAFAAAVVEPPLSVRA